MTDLDHEATRLTMAQREALRLASSTPHGNFWLACHGATKAALVSKGLAKGHGDWCILTDAGKTLRDHILSQDKSYG